MPHSQYSKIFTRCFFKFLCLHIQEAYIPLADPSCHPGTSKYSDGMTIFRNSNIPAIEKIRHSTQVETEQTRSFLEKRPFFREEKIIPVKIHLLVIGLYLGEIGIGSQIEGEVTVNTVFNIETGIVLRIIIENIACFSIIHLPVA